MDHPILVTGGLGFIGSAVVRRLVAGGTEVVNLDAMTYAASPERLEGVAHDRLTTHRCDVTDEERVRSLVRQAAPRLLIHLAAESHVTRSETDQSLVMSTNVEGTRVLLEAALDAGVERVLHVSTDEVYGPCPEGSFSEDAKEPGEGRATSPYARSKALADDIARSFFGRLPVIVVRPTNCFGPWQHPEKAVARWVTRALAGKGLPVWGDGGQTREWMHVDDAVAGIELIALQGVPGNVYNLGPGNRGITNLEVAAEIARRAGTESAPYLTEYDRPDHDRRYAVDSSRARALGWEPRWQLEAGIDATVDWYRAHEGWWKSLLPDAEAIYRDEAAAS